MTMPTENDRTITPAEFFRLAVLFEGGLLAVAIVLAALMNPSPWTRLNLGLHTTAIGVVATLPMLAALWLMRNVCAGALGRLNRVVDEWLVPLIRGAPLWQYAIVAALAGLGEELLFRGVVQEWLTSHLGQWGAIAATSVAFGLAHLITPLYGLLAGLVSLYFGWLFASFDSLAIPIVAHVLYDFIALWYLPRTARIPLSPSDPLITK